MMSPSVPILMTIVLIIIILYMCSFTPFGIIIT